MIKRKDISKRIAQIQEEIGLNGIDFADQLGTSASFLSDIKNQQKKPSIEILAKLSEKFNINIDWLLRGIGDMFYETEVILPIHKRMKLLPVVGEVQCGIPLGEYDNATQRETILVGNITGGRESFVLIARGDSMMPRIESGDKLVCVATEKREIRDGDIVIISFVSSVGITESNCKIIRFYDKDNRFVLMSLNPNYPAQEYPITDIYRIYKVKQIIRELR